MGILKNLEQSAKSVKKGRKKSSKLIDGEVKDNLAKIIKSLGALDNSMKAKVVKPALTAAAKIVQKKAAANVRAIKSRQPYSGGTPGNSRNTGTREKWSNKAAAKRASGNHDDLSRSIKIKSLPTIRRKKSPVVVIVGPEAKKFGFGHLLEFGAASYPKPAAHYLWGGVNDIDRIQPMPFLEPAAKETATQQVAAIVRVIKERWPKA